MKRTLTILNHRMSKATKLVYTYIVWILMTKNKKKSKILIDYGTNILFICIPRNQKLGSFRGILSKKSR